MDNIDTIPYEKLKMRNIDGTENLVTVIVQDWKSKDVLMVAYANKEAIEKTVKTGFAHYYSTSRNKLWKKGEQSGNTQQVKEIYVDCDGDAMIYSVVQKGGACHKGYRSCFFRKMGKNGLAIVEKRLFEPEKVYRS